MLNICLNVFNFFLELQEVLSWPWNERDDRLNKAYMNNTLIKGLFTETQGGLSEPTKNGRHLQEAFSTAQSKGISGESSVIGALCQPEA